MAYREVVIERDSPVVERRNGSGVILGVVAAILLGLLLWFLVLGGGIGRSRSSGSTSTRNAPAQTSDNSSSNDSGASKITGEGTATIKGDGGGGVKVEGSGSATKNP